MNEMPTFARDKSIKVAFSQGRFQGDHIFNRHWEMQGTWLVDPTVPFALNIEHIYSIELA